MCLNKWKISRTLYPIKIMKRYPSVWHSMYSYGLTKIERKKIKRNRLISVKSIDTYWLGYLEIECKVLKNTALIWLQMCHFTHAWKLFLKKCEKCVKSFFFSILNHTFPLTQQVFKTTYMAYSSWIRILQFVS